MVMAEKASAPPVKLFKSLQFLPQDPIPLRPILTPDNYLPEIGRLLAGAKQSIWIENQYIKTDQTEIQKLLAKIDLARKRYPKLEVRVILAKGFDGGVAVAAAFAALTKEHRLKVGTHLRLLNPKHFDHLHNKLILVDGSRVLISSQNWSNSAVSENREAGLLMDSPRLAEYYGAIFESDWADALQKAPKPRPARRTTEALVAGAVGPADRGDYAEV
jgi:phosphatidylserine/phosphatidylglycerophosphate/cardiolipin synthase-like enzyme